MNFSDDMDDAYEEWRARDPLGYEAHLQAIRQRETDLNTARYERYRRLLDEKVILKPGEVGGDDE